MNGSDHVDNTDYAGARSCSHPHIDRGSAQLLKVPVDPLGQQVQLVLYTEAGPIPYCGMDNLRALHAADNLGQRHIAARTAFAYDIGPGDDWATGKYDLAQLVIAGALAEAEERFCVADHCRRQATTAMLNQRSRNGSSGDAT